MHERLAEALSQISEKHIAEAAAMKPRRRKYVASAIAAILAIVLLMNIGFTPAEVIDVPKVTEAMEVMDVPKVTEVTEVPEVPVILAKVVSKASDSRTAPVPDPDDYPDLTAYRTAQEAWEEQRDQRSPQVTAALSSLRGFFAESTGQYLGNAEGENRVWSPVNAYIALAMLAEVTDGNSREQILDLLNTQDLDTLRTRTSAIWEMAYTGGESEICSLANSLWLDENLCYDQQTMDNLAYHYYASVYQTDLGSNESETSLQAWLYNNTGSLLKGNEANASFPPDAAMTIASTVYLRSTWCEHFNPENNTDGIFHSPSGDQEVTFMNKENLHTDYYRGDSYGAIALGLHNKTQMWLIMPDEDKSVDDVLAEGQFWRHLMPSTGEQKGGKEVGANLSLPKFDVASSADLNSMLQGMGLTDVFDPQKSNFTAILSDFPVVLTAVDQAARVIVDEQGVTAASCVQSWFFGLPSETIDFVLDRPFLFVIAHESGIPLFAGVVNEP